MILDLSGPRPGLKLDAASLRLTPEQQSAMAFDRELVVTAGAGAGKTHVLSLRYVALLLELAAVAVENDRSSPRPAIEQVLVLTFTEKAADEMAERCYRRLLALAKSVRTGISALDRRYGAGYGRALSAALDHLCDSFPRGHLSTFHSFCSRLLREFPAETRTPPGYRVLEAAEADERVSRILESALRDLSQKTPTSAGAAVPEDLAVLLDAFGSRRQLLAAARIALDRRGVLEHRLEEHADGEVDLAVLLQRAEVTPKQARDWLSAVGRPTLAAIVKLTAPSGGGQVVKTRIAPLLQRLSVPLELKTDDSRLRAYGLYRDTLQALITTSGELRTLSHHSVVGHRAAWSDTRRYALAKQALSTLAERCVDWPERLEVARRLPTHADSAMLVALGALARLVRKAHQALLERFEAERVLDFTELQIRAVRAVLHSDALRSALQQRYRYLMVDEFQDTDQLQLDLVLSVGRPAGARRDRVFLVGDVKQAIYGFRGGDVTVFSRARAAIDTPPVVLPDNFRSRPELIAWFNTAFRTILGPPDPERPAYEAPYLPITAGRESERPGTLTAVVRASDAEDTSGPWAAEAVARMVATELLAGVGRWSDEGLADRERHPTPPIAVLLRARTHLLAYEEALQRHGVPYQVARGVGFWVRPEVVDGVNLLHALATESPLSLVGVLRSPLLAVPDPEIQALCSGQAVGQPWVERFGRHPISGPPALADAAARWRRWRSWRDRLPVADLLERVLNDASIWHALALEDPGSGQGAANVRRLVELVRAAEREGAGLLEIAERFLDRVVSEERESEAVVAPGAARVLLLTVHASKGLEFPVVVVPELHTRAPGGGAPLAVRRLVGSGWDLACRVLDPEADVQTRVRPGLLQQLEDVRRAEERAERARLLYVAVTRARDHLVLLGTASSAPASPPNTWMQMLEAHHDLGLAASRGLIWRDADEVLALEPPADTPDADAETTRHDLEPIQAPLELTVGPSSLDRLDACPARWYRSAWLRIPEPEAPGSRQAPEDGESLGRAIAAARGDVIHSLFEDDVVDDLAIARARWRARALQEGMTAAEATWSFSRLEAHLHEVGGDPWLRQVRQSEGWPEVPIRVRRGPVVLRGQIDRLWRDGDDWVVLDFKSEQLRDRTLAEAAAGHARQMLAYAWAASRVLEGHGHGVVRYADLYFTEVGERWRLGPFGSEHFDYVEQMLDAAAQWVGQSWADVERLATREERPCPGCGYWRRGCRGRAPE